MLPTSKQEARREHSLLSLVELSDELSVSKNLYEIADVALFNILGHFGASRMALWLLPEGGVGGTAVLVRCHGIPKAVARGMGSAWARRLFSDLTEIPNHFLVDQIGDDGIEVELARKHKIAVVAPVTVRKNVVGLAALGHRVGGEGYGQLELDLVRASLSLLGVALDNTKLYTRLFENNRQLTRANEELKELDDLKSEFLCNLNHELRTPLTIMMGNIENLLVAEEEGSAKYKLLQVVLEQNSKLSGLLLNLLDLSAVVDEEGPVRRSVHDVRPVLRRYYEDRKPGITAGLRDIKFTCPRDLPRATFDADKLYQILDCLVDNAVKFTPPGSHVDVVVVAPDEEERCVRIDVKDDGPGIPDEMLSKIFDAFQQGDGSMTRTAGGMGVGLALAKRLAARMGASLDVESVLGSGTTFSLRLSILS